MEQYIPKSALISEIERRIKNLYPKEGQGMVVTKILKDHYEDLLSSLDTLEVKEVQEEPVSEDLEEASKEWLKPQLDKSYADYGETKMMELTRFDGYAMLDAIEFGAQWQFDRVTEALLSEVLPCFMHGGEADEVVAKLDEVLNQKK